MKYCPLCGSCLAPLIHEGRKKQFCSSKGCDYVFWNNPIPVVLGIVELNGKYIVTNNAEWPEWKYSLISGFVDYKESPETAIVREVKEELNLIVNSCQLVNITLYERLNQLMICFFVETSGQIRLNPENRAFKLLSLEALAKWEFGKGATPAINKWLEDTAH